MSRALSYGGVPVPWTVSWTGEQHHALAICPHAPKHNSMKALVQSDAPGDGKPDFSNPHFNRQREAINLCLCDLCGRPLSSSTKVSLSHARPRVNGAKVFDILQVEPLMHRQCAAICIEHCPSLKRDIKRGTLHVRQVYRHAVQMAVVSEMGIAELTGISVKAFGYAKVQLLKWKDRDEAWLRAKVTA